MPQLMKAVVYVSYDGLLQTFVGDGTEVVGRDSQLCWHRRGLPLTERKKKCLLEFWKLLLRLRFDWQEKQVTPASSTRNLVWDEKFSFAVTVACSAACVLQCEERIVVFSFRGEIQSRAHEIHHWNLVGIDPFFDCCEIRIVGRSVSRFDRRLQAGLKILQAEFILTRIYTNKNHNQIFYWYNKI